MSDSISREVVIGAVKRLSLGETDATRLAMRIGDYLKRVPSAQPERIRGKWVNYGEGECCDQCGRYPYDDGEFHILGWRSNFCPHCGADMREKGENATD